MSTIKGIAQRLKGKTDEEIVDIQFELILSDIDALEGDGEEFDANIDLVIRIHQDYFLELEESLADFQKYVDDNTKVPEKEAAKRMGMSLDTLRRKRKDGLIEPWSKTKPIVYLNKDVKAFRW